MRVQSHAIKPYLVVTALHVLLYNGSSASVIARTRSLKHPDQWRGLKDGAQGPDWLITRRGECGMQPAGRRGGEQQVLLRVVAERIQKTGYLAGQKKGKEPDDIFIMIRNWYIVH